MSSDITVFYSSESKIKLAEIYPQEDPFDLKYLLRIHEDRFTRKEALEFINWLIENKERLK